MKSHSTLPKHTKQHTSISVDTGAEVGMDSKDKKTNQICSQRSTVEGEIKNVYHIFGNHLIAIMTVSRRASKKVCNFFNKLL